MANNKGFTLIELLAVIVVLAIVTVLATTSVLPLGSQAREKAFRIEATNAVQSAEQALNLYNLGELRFSNDTSHCYNPTTKIMCFTINDLIDREYYDMEKGTFAGRVDIDLSKEEPTYQLYLKKNDEFRFVGLTQNDYNDDSKSTINNADWLESYNNCTCTKSS